MLIYKKKNQFKNKTAIVLGSDGLIGKEIVKNLIDLHNASINASNRTDQKGASMEIIFPKI